ncbi:MAG TPA: hypothetical protein VG605_13665 [Puia sp.]|nr:hypothetical protein [Puia sp.]
MNSFELLEAVFVGIIIVLQAYNFYQTNRRIAVYRHIFPEEGSFEVFNVSLSKEALKLHPRELLGRLNEWALGGDEVIDLIRRKGGGNEVTDKIVYSLNTYLLRNKGVASDFHLIKDIVERNCDSVEEDVHQTISLPLYLGLLGTFVGIVVGLVKISGIDFAGENNGMDLAISALLKGVMIAMIASFFGLMLTVLNNGFFFKGAKAQLEHRKNDFYTFVQTELLPLLNQNINSTLYSLQTNLFRFNEEFKDNIGMLREVMGKNYDALVAQEKILNTLENIDITEFGKANVVILQQLNISTEKLAQFNNYLGQLSELMGATSRVSSQLDSAIARSDNFDALGQKLMTMFTENQRLVEFLQSHYDALDESHQLITTAVNRVGNTLDESLDKLSIFTQERINELQKITLREMDLLVNQYPDKWKRLDSLIYLETMSKHLAELKTGTVQQQDRMDREFRELNASFDRAVMELTQIRAANDSRWGNRVAAFFRKLGRWNRKAGGAGPR